MTPRLRLWTRVVITDSCWVYTGPLDAEGYAHIWNGETTPLAHRWVYELLVGPIPEGLQIDHLCFVRHCVRPDHLEAVTNAENQRRAALARTHCKQGHEFAGPNLLRRTDGGRRCRTCRDERNRAGYLRRRTAA